ncbi:glycoside hydrolase family 88/105 protein [Cellulomonas hominis]|uniref:glycoside hydrolase family 88/105 protein n=1 Tax=Cellulomonas hominis TaxID=156981 RepID=UPI001444284E|nr:glycoside hydrolase family 88 protein [Cellulomonas hominis]NKY09685.1 glycosyl hydrolase family 88 [Cellulomonas hominis]
MTTSETVTGRGGAGPLRAAVSGSTTTRSTTTGWAALGADTMLSREPLMNLRDRWEYEDGLMLNGVWAVHRLTGDPRYRDYVRRNIDHFVREDGSILGYDREDYNLDHLNNGKAVLDLLEETGDPRYRLAADRLFDQIKRQPRLRAGTFWHKRIYPDQVWLDGLYMGSVFYARYCVLTGHDDLLDDVVLQFTSAYELTLEGPSGLCRHACDESRRMPWADPQTGRSPHVWLRALGWFVMAMADVLEHLPRAHPGHATIRRQLEDVLTALLRVRDPRTGLWFQIPDQGERPLNYLESSGSLMVLAAIATSLRRGYLAGPDWEQALDRGWAHATDEFLSVDAQGWVNVHRMCHVGGLGGVPYRDGSYSYYMSEPIVTNDHKGVGPFLLLAAEMQRREDERTAP